MSAMASHITSLAIVYPTVYSGADQRKYQSSASLAFVRGIHQWLVNSLHKRPVRRKMFPFDDVIMNLRSITQHLPTLTEPSTISASYTIHANNYAHSLHFFMFCSDFVAFNFANILRDYFSGTGAILSVTVPQCHRCGFPHKPTGSYQSGRSPKVVALFLLQTLVAI